MSKHLFIVHRWAGSADADWYPCLQSKLPSDVVVHISDYPEAKLPVIEKWVPYLSEQVSNELKKVGTTLKEDLSNAYFIGHSVGTQTVGRYLATLPENTHVGGAVLVGAWFTVNESWESLNPWLNTPFDYDRVKQVTKEHPIVAIVSDNDRFTNGEAMTKNIELLKERYNAEIIMRPGENHFNEKEEPGVVEQVLAMLSK